MTSKKGKRAINPLGTLLSCTHAGNAGIGSVVHHMGQALALAIETNRTLVVAPDSGYPYTDTDRCFPPCRISCCADL